MPTAPGDFGAFQPGPSIKAVTESDSVFMTHPDTGEVVELPRQQFEQARQQGFGVPSPAQFKQLEGLEKDRIAGEHPGTAGLVGALRGATFGGSDIALGATGLAEPEALDRLSGENPTADLGGELLGGGLSFGGAVRGVGALAKGVPSVLGRASLGSGAASAAFGGGGELARQSRAGEDFDFGQAGLATLSSGAAGAARPLAGPALVGAGGLAKRAGLSGLQKGADATRQALTPQLDLFQKSGSGKLSSLIGGAGGRVGSAAAGGVLATGSDLLSQSKSATRLGRNIDFGQALASGLKGAASGAVLPARSVAKIASKVLPLGGLRGAAQQTAGSIGRFAGRELSKSKQAQLTTQLIRRIRDRNPHMSKADVQKFLEQRSNVFEGTSQALGSSSRSADIGQRRVFEEGLESAEELARRRSPFPQGAPVEDVLENLKANAARQRELRAVAARASLGTKGGRGRRSPTSELNEMAAQLPGFDDAF